LFKLYSNLIISFQVTAIPKPENTPDINGCGSYNINIPFNTLGMQEFTECCNVHDFCYEECHKDQLNCDNSFEGCLVGECKKWAEENDWNALKQLGNITCIKKASI
jgi:hypothetical protein